MLASTDVGDRPIFADGLPRRGFLPQVDGLYIAVGHPGVILAPLIGRLTAEEILDGRRNELIPDPKWTALGGGAVSIFASGAFQPITHQGTIPSLRIWTCRKSRALGNSHGIVSASG
jgi:hypothetical protein